MPSPTPVTSAGHLRANVSYGVMVLSRLLSWLSSLTDTRAYVWARGGFMQVCVLGVGGIVAVVAVAARMFATAKLRTPAPLCHAMRCILHAKG
jgi:hypothetical protein